MVAGLAALGNGAALADRNDGLPPKPPPLGADERLAPPNTGAPSTGIPGRVAPDRVSPDSNAPRPGEQPTSSGTGFVVAEGRVMTNNHVITDCSRVAVRTPAGQRLTARVGPIDRRRDLALLIVSAEVGPPLAFRDNPAIRRGETVITYGFPLSGLLSSGPTLTTGDVSALAGLRDDPANIQITAPVNPGNSGGPLLDIQANVVGVVVSKLNAMRTAQMTGGDIPQNVNFAVKGTEALAFLRENNVRPTIRDSTGPDKRVFEVGEIANASTVYILCFR